jgi:hypothetical protein
VFLAEAVHVLNLAIDDFDGYTHSADAISFDVTNTDGSWASASQVLALNANSFDAATHGFVTSSPANRSNGAIATGFAGEGPGTRIPTPEPGTLGLLGAALAALGWFGHRRDKGNTLALA